MVADREIKQQISRHYASRLGTDETGRDLDRKAGVYPLGVLGSMPDSVVSFGCGNPVALASLKTGETVLDLGSGAGLDCFMAARQVGPTGQVIGVDFTPEMIDRAAANARRLKLTNVSFRLGDIEVLPIDSGSVDVVTSNCVINLVPDKDAAFREAHRVLRPGGRLMIADIVLTRPASEAEQEDMALRCSCVSGSLPADDYLAKVRAAGFVDVRAEAEEAPQEGAFWYSALLSGVKR